MSGEVAPFRVPPVIKRMSIDLPLQAAFDRFVNDIAEWWPRASHSISREACETVVIESGVGGRMFERDTEGNEHLWGTVTRWDPPSGFAATWHVGRAPDTAQLLELSFRPEAEGRTLVELVHSGWEALGEQAEETRNEYETGWGGVLPPYFEAHGGNWS